MLDKEIDLELGHLGIEHRERSPPTEGEVEQDVLDMARVFDTEIVVDTHQAVVDGEMAEDATVAATEVDEDGQHVEDILAAKVCSAKDEVVVGGCNLDSMDVVRVCVPGLGFEMVAASAAVGEVAVGDEAVVAASAQVWLERGRRHQTC